MKYAVWFVRLVFAAWMIPAGINHFYRIFPQPLGRQPFSRELFLALVDSGLFDLVKAVELIAGLGLMAGFYLPLMLVIAMPVSFCVWYWDTELEGWSSRAAWFGSAVMLCNSLLCLAYAKTYNALFNLRPKPQMHPVLNMLPAREQLILGGRLIFGAWMLISGINYFFVSFYPMPTGSEPLAVQLMTALVNSSLLDVVVAFQLVTGALILAGFLVPLALCVVMPLSVCAAYWAVILEHQFLGAILALAAVALNGVLMLAYFDYYKGILQRYALAPGEEEGTSYNALFVNLKGLTSRHQYIGALATLLAVLGFYYFIVPGLTSQWCQMMLLFPAIGLHAGRLRDMGQTAWLLVVPAVLIITGFWFNAYNPQAQAKDMVALAALIVSAGFVLWALIGKSQADVEKPAAG